MYSAELYDNLLQNQNSQYSLPKMTKTLVVCGALLLNTSGQLLQEPIRVSLPPSKSGSDGYILNQLYSSDTPTWSDVKTTFSPLENSNDDIIETFNVLRKLAFLEGDAVAEKEADHFFGQVQVKTKKIMVRRKA